MELGNVIVECRSMRELSQVDLARKADVSVSHLCLIEKDERSPSIGIIQAIADAMDVPLPLLMALAAEPGQISELTEEQVTTMTAALRVLIKRGAETQ
ncbi:MAG: helix-turn-helix transcriptional regulator [Halieaceae bacterium]